MENEIGTCHGCVGLPHCRLGIVQFEGRDDGNLRGTGTCPPTYEGGPGVAHGGWTAAAFDDVIGRGLFLAGHLAVTATLTVQFIRPVPVGRDLAFTGRLIGREGQRLHVEADLVLQATGARLASAHGTWVERDAGHFDRHRAWMVEQEASARRRPNAAPGPIATTQR